MRTVLSIVLIAAALGLNLRGDQFSQFQKTYGRTYSSVEAKLRAKIFEDNLKTIEEHNARNLPWTMGINKFADLSDEEFQFKFCGCANDPMRNDDEEVTELPVFADAPERIDWREKGAVTRVKHQGSCGSCWAFSTTGVVESAYFLHSGELIEVSEQQLVDCARRPDYDAYGCRGGWPRSAIDYVKDRGICSEAEYPYQGVETECAQDTCKVVIQSTGKVQLPKKDEDTLQKAVGLTPVSVTVDATVFKLYKGGIITECNEIINHGVLAVGMDTEGDLPFYYVKNSWGEDWGEEGYCRIERGVGGYGRCGIAYSSVYPTFEAK